MAEGMSKANARQSSKSPKWRSKAGLPAKAGKRRPPHIQRDADGNYVAVKTGQPRKSAPIEKPRYAMLHDVKPQAVTKPPRGAALASGLRKIDELARQWRASSSDPFAAARLRTHFRHGLAELS